MVTKAIAAAPDDLKSASDASLAPARAQATLPSESPRGTMDSGDRQVDEQHPDLTVFVRNLLKEMQGRFQTMSALFCETVAVCGC